jgi:biotin transport system substrate-specific component
MNKSNKAGLRAMLFAALMAAVMCVVGPFSIPLPVTAVPISFTNLVICFAAYILGARGATISCVVYLLIGFVGMPVFSGFTGGVSKIAGPTGGYLLGFILLAFICGFAADRYNGNRFFYIISMVVGLVADYAIGTAWLAWQGNLSFEAALFAGVIPFIPGDALKVVVVALVCAPAKRMLMRRLNAN